MHKGLYQFVEDHNKILYKRQFGFQRKHSTGQSLKEIAPSIWMGYFYRLKKGFWHCDHQILLTKLEHYGIRGTLLV